MFRRIAFALLIAAPVEAATLRVVPDQPYYVVGDTMTLTVMGDPEGAATTGVYGVLNLTQCLQAAWPLGVNQAMLGDSDNWEPRELSYPLSSPRFMTAFYQLSVLPSEDAVDRVPRQADTPNGERVISTVQFMAYQGSAFVLYWSNLGFFDLRMGEEGGAMLALSMQIYSSREYAEWTTGGNPVFVAPVLRSTPVPEPSTGLLAGLGLGVLAASGSRKRHAASRLR